MKNTICVAQSWDKIHKYLFKPTYKRTFGGRKKKMDIHYTTKCFDMLKYQNRAIPRKPMIKPE